MHERIEKLCSLKNKLIDELIEQGNKDGTLNNIDTLAHAIKNIDKTIHDLKTEEAEYENGYSGRYPYYSYNRMPMQEDHYYADARRRDSMGRYASSPDFKSSLYEAMGKAQTEEERQMLQNILNRMPNN